MNCKRSKQHKRAKKALKTVTKNGDAEVFVLPPYLLQKLGINLNSVEKKQEYPTIPSADTETPVVEFLNCNQNGVSKIENDSTILETADLMKKSVLLSPTFATNINNVDEGRSYITETENYDEMITTKLAEDKISVTADAVILPKSMSDKLLDSPVSYNDTGGCGNYPVISGYGSLSNQNDPLSLSGCSSLNIPENFHVVCPEENADEAYASDCSNSNLGPLETSETIGTNQLNQPTPIHKINILSEEILTPTQIKELKIFHTTNISDLKSVPIKAILKNVDYGDGSYQINVNKAPAMNHNLGVYNCRTTESHLNPNNTENIIFFDDKGNVIQSDPNNGKLEPHFEEGSEIHARPLHEDSSHKNIMPDNSFGPCIDIEVTDIEMHLKENEETLETFVNEITSTENHEILAEIEKSEKESLIQLHELQVIDVPKGDLSLLNITEYTEPSEIDFKEDYKFKNLMIDGDTNGKDSDKEFYNGSLNNIEKSIATVADAYELKIKQKISANNGPLNNIDDTIATVANANELQIKQKISANNGSLNNIEKSIATVANAYELQIKEKILANNMKDVAVADVFTSNFNLKQEKEDNRLCNAEKTGDVDSSNKDKTTVLKGPKCYNTTECLNTKKISTDSTDNDEIVHHISDTITKSQDYSRGSNNNKESIKKEQTKQRITAQNNVKNITVASINSNTKEVKKYHHMNKNCNLGEKVDVSQKKDKSVPRDKIKEIATYIAQAIKNRKTQNLIHKTSAPLITHKQYKGPKSKLHIQGVEKPGGSVKKEKSDETSKNIKTYRNINRIESTKTSDENIESKHEFSVLELNTKMTEFCQCGDFGSFTFYDLCSSYEHIHFWEHVKIETDPEIVFSIYNDDSYAEYKPVNEIHEDQDDGTEGDTHIICWCKLKKSKHVEHNIIESSLVEEKVNFENVSVLKALQAPKGKNEINSMGDISLGGMGEIKEDESISVLSETRESGHSKSNDGRQPDESTSTTNADSETRKLLLPDKKSVDVFKGETKDVPKLREVIRRKSNVVDATKERVENKTIPKEENEENMNKKIVQESGTSNAKERPQSVELTKSKKKDVAVEKSVRTDQHKTKETRRKSSTIESGLNNSQQSKIDQSLTHKEDSSTSKQSKLLKNVADDIDSGFSSQQSSSMEIESVVNNITEVNSENIKKDLGTDKPRKDEKKKNTELKKTNESDGSESDQNLSEIKRRKALKRKICSKTKVRDSQDHSEEPSIKKSTKCGVCNLVLSENEWENHVSKEHCFIAWKAGSDIDWNDTELLNKLQGRLKEQESLSCSFCSKYVQNESAKKFLRHVRKCSKQTQEDGDTSLDTTKDRINNSHVETKDVVPKRSGRKRKISETQELTKCAVCQDDVPVPAWISHIAEKHNYLAWKICEPAIALDDEDAVKQHLFAIVKQIGDLTCSHCGLVRRYPKAYMAHIQKCIKENKDSSKPKETSVTSPEMSFTMPETSVTKPETSVTRPSEVFTCGVCKKKIPEDKWVDHIGKEHGYLAWKDSDTPLDTTNEDAVKEYLYAISKQNGHLTCGKCGINRKYVKTFLQHYNSCNGPEYDSTNIKVEKREHFTCGVCHKEIAKNKWIEHIYKAHDYLAWKEGESLDINDEEQVYDHLFAITSETDGLKCSKCGTVRKYVKNYLQHKKECDHKPEEIDYDSNNETQDSGDTIVCGVCKKTIERKMWMSHKMKNHYNIAWAANESPIDYRSSYLIERLLKEYREKHHKLLCKVCKATRVSLIGFYAHIVTCGKTPEEIDEHKMECDICNKKYLRIYHNQHMAWHTQQQYAKERKELMLEKAEQKIEIEEKEVEDVKPGSRKAAQKAKTVIQKIKAEMNQLAHKCNKCGFGSDDKVEFDGHFCEDNESKMSDTDDSVKMDGSAPESDDDDDDDIDSNVSEEEREALLKGRREKIPSFAKVQRLPFLPKNVNQYLKKSSQEFYAQHFTSERLFPEMSVGEYEEVANENLRDYMPPIETSCKLRLKPDDSWSTLNRFEAVKGMGHLTFNMFTGTAVRSICWVPCHGDSKTEDQYLTVVGYNREDSPRFDAEETPAHPGLIQIWNLRQFQEVPEFVMGIAHDYGTAWGVDWCPSGARDELPDSTVKLESLPRFGLLAVSFSNGSAYIFSVPYPSSIVLKDKVVYKLKPVAELRMSMATERKKYQATSIHWSSAKGHKTITVGYSDGSLGYFDLKTESPLLKSEENGITIFYPYHDERTHGTCITGVATYPSADPSVMGPTCVSSPTGAALISCPITKPARIHSHTPSAGVCFDPLWPSAVLVGDEIGSIGAINELELYGGGRRLGGAGAAAACCRCVRLALFSQPTVRLLSVHPVANLPKKLIIGALFMTPLVKKNKIQQDELAVKLEPLTYQDTIVRYGLELRLDKAEMNKKGRVPHADYCPERYPLANVASMAFCPSASHHFRLAVATHSGLVFIFYT